MVRGYFSSLKKNNEVQKERLANRRLKGVCTKCGGKLNHLKIECDYCYLRGKIRELEKLLWRLEKIMNVRT
jgi:hypothetical protein